MKISSTLFAVSAAPVVAPSIAACGGDKPIPPANAIQNELDGAPDWVVKGCSVYFKNKEDRKICGVGSVGSTRNAGMARTGAVARARTEIARQLEVKVESMLKDYQATTTGGEKYGQVANDEQNITDVSKQITSQTLSGTEMIDSWVSNSGTYYALVALDTETFKGQIDKMGQLSEATRKAVQARADKAFDELADEMRARDNK